MCDVGARYGYGGVDCLLGDITFECKQNKRPLPAPPKDILSVTHFRVNPSDGGRLAARATIAIAERCVHKFRR